MANDQAFSRKKLRLAGVFTIISVIILLSLGTWQVVRLQTKLSLIAKIEERIQLKPVALPFDESLDLTEWEYRQVILSGQWLHDEERYLFTGPKYMRGKIGYDILTPMKLTDQDVILVDRGWVPFDKKAQSQRTDTLISGGDIQIVGMIHKKEHPGLFTPKNDESKNMWFWIDVSAMLKGIVHSPEAEEYYIRQVAPDDADNVVPSLPILGDKKVKYRNDHLQYAITWYSLAIILIIVYVAFRRAHLKQV